MSLKNGLVPFLLLAVAATAAMQELPTPYDLIRPVWPLTWDSTVFEHFVPDDFPRQPLPDTLTPAGYAPNEIMPIEMDQAYLDAINYRISPIRVNQAGYLEKDVEKQFYYVGNATTFEVVDVNGHSLSPAVTGTFTPSGKTISSSWQINAGTNAATSNQDRYSLLVTGQSGFVQVGKLGNLSLPTDTRLRIKVGNDISSTFIISEKVYSMVRSAALKFYGINRSGYGESWFHPASHTKDGAGPVTNVSESSEKSYDASLAGTLEGGYYDCGDHLKESQTQMYAFMVAALMAATNEDADDDQYSYNQEKTIRDGIPDMLREAKHGADFVFKAYRRANGVIDDMALSIGSKGSDHNWWNRPEFSDGMPVDNSNAANDRGGPKTRLVRLGEIGSNVGGETAAGLAILGKILSEQYPEYKSYADSCLLIAEKMYDFANSLAQGKGSYDGGKAFVHNKKPATWESAAYQGNNEFYDDMALASVALLYATGKKEYADDMIRNKNMVPVSSDFPRQEYMENCAGCFEGGWFVTNDKGFLKNGKNTSWANSYSYALYALYKLILADKDKAMNVYGLSESEWLNAIEDCVANMIYNLGDMSLGNGSASIDLPAGNIIWKSTTVKYDPMWYTMFFPDTWIYNRYQAGNIFEVLAYADVAADIEGKGLALPIMGAPNWKTAEMYQLGLNQLNYLLGVNPWDVSFIYGIGDKNDAHPHHRAANPEGKNVAGTPYQYKVPVGALFGGVKPDATNDWDPGTRSWEEYHISETCIDATATLVSSGMLASQKINRTRPPKMQVEIRHVSMDSAIVVVKLDIRGTALIKYGKTDDASGMNNTAKPDNDIPGVEHEIVLRNLEPGTMYYFYAGGINAYNPDSISTKYMVDSTQTPFSFTTLNTIENAEIKNVTVCNVSADSAEIMWYTPNGEYESKLYWDTIPHTNASEFAHNTGSGNADISGYPTKFHYVKIGGLKESTTYYYAVESNGQYTNVNEAGAMLKFTTPVTQYDFGVYTYQYSWSEKPAIMMAIFNNESRPFDSLTVRMFMRGDDDLYDDVAIRTDICQAYDEAGFNKACDVSTLNQLNEGFRHVRPVKVEDTYDAASGTWQWYFPIPLGSTVIKSASRFRVDVVFVARIRAPGQDDPLDVPPQNKKLYCNVGSSWYWVSDEERVGPTLTANPGDWSWMPHSKASGDYADYPGMPCLNKNYGDGDFKAAPLNPYVAVYRKDEFVWGYSPSRSEMETKRANYKIDVTLDAPFNVSNGSHVEIDQPSSTVFVKGHAHITEGGYITKIWANGTQLPLERIVVDNTSYMGYNGMVVAQYNMATGLWDLNIPVKMGIGSNKVDITIFAGPDPECEACIENGGCAFENRSYYVQFTKGDATASALTIKDEAGNPVKSPADPAGTRFNIFLTDKDKAKYTQPIEVLVINNRKNDTLRVAMEPVAGNPGSFQSKIMVTALEVAKDMRTNGQISFFAGDTIQVIYIDPEDEEDVSKQTFFSESTYPAPRQVLAQDTDCDNIADRLSITFTNAFDEDYSFDSVRVYIEGMADTVTLSVPQPVSGLNEITIPLTGVTVPETAAPTGTVGIYLQTKGQVSRENAKITDGIPPQLLSVTILENPVPRSTEDTLMIAFTEPVMLSSPGAWPLAIEGVSGDHISVSGKATTNNGGKSWLFVVTGNDNGSYIPVGGIASIRSGVNVTDEALNALDPASPCAQGVKIAETPKPVPVTLAEMRDNEGDGYADEIYLKFEKKLRDKDMLDSFVVEWGMKNITKSFRPNDWTHTMEYGEHWQHNQKLDSLTGTVTDDSTLVKDTVSIITIALTASNGFPYGTTSGSYDGYGHVTPRLGPEGGFFDKYYFVVDKCPPVIMKATKSSSGSLGLLEATMSEPLATISNTALEYIERRRGSQAGVYLRPKATTTKNEIKESYAYDEDADDAVRTGDYVRLVPIATLSRYKDKAGNYPTEQNPWVAVGGSAAEKTKFRVTLAHSVTQPSSVEHYAGTQVSDKEVFRATVINQDGTETLMGLEDGVLAATGTVLDTNIYKHAGPQFIVEMTIPSALLTDDFGNPLFDFDIKFTMDLYDNLGQFIARQDVSLNLKEIGYDKVSDDGVLRLNMEWMAKDGSPKSRKGRKLGTGAYIAKFDFESKATYVAETSTAQEDGPAYEKGDVIKTTDNTTKTFGFKRAKRK